MLKASAAVLLVALFLPLCLLSQTISTLTGNNTSGCSTASNMNANCSAAFNGMADTGLTFNIAPTNVSKVDIHTLIYGNAASSQTKSSTPIYVHFVPWFHAAPTGPAQDGVAVAAELASNVNADPSYPATASVDPVMRNRVWLTLKTDPPPGQCPALIGFDQPGDGESTYTVTAGAFTCMN